MSHLHCPSCGLDVASHRVGYRRSCPRCLVRRNERVLMDAVRRYPPPLPLPVASHQALPGERLA
jgi:hypothetical protein